MGGGYTDQLRIDYHTYRYIGLFIQPSPVNLFGQLCLVFEISTSILNGNMNLIIDLIFCNIAKKRILNGCCYNRNRMQMIDRCQERMPSELCISFSSFSISTFACINCYAVGTYAYNFKRK